MRFLTFLSLIFYFYHRPSPPPPPLLLPVPFYYAFIFYPLYYFFIRKAETVDIPGQALVKRSVELSQLCQEASETCLPCPSGLLPSPDPHLLLFFFSLSPCYSFLPNLFFIRPFLRACLSSSPLFYFYSSLRSSVYPSTEAYIKIPRVDLSRCNGWLGDALVFNLLAFLCRTRGTIGA